VSQISKTKEKRACAQDRGSGSSVLKPKTQEQKDQYGNGNGQIAYPKNWTSIVDCRISFLDDLSDVTISASQKKNRASYARCRPKTLSQPNTKHSANSPAQVGQSHLELKGASRLPTDFASYFVSHEGVSVPSQETTHADVYHEQIQQKEFNYSCSCTGFLTQYHVQSKTDKGRRYENDGQQDSPPVLYTNRIIRVKSNLSDTAKFKEYSPCIRPPRDSP
jgi:hypothetical protein